VHSAAVRAGRRREEREPDREAAAPSDEGRRARRQGQTASLALTRSSSALSSSTGLCPFKTLLQPPATRRATRTAAPRRPRPRVPSLSPLLPLPPDRRRSTSSPTRPSHLKGQPLVDHALLGHHIGTRRRRPRPRLGSIGHRSGLGRTRLVLVVLILGPVSHLDQQHRCVCTPLMTRRHGTR